MSSARLESAMLAAQNVADLIAHFRNIEINGAYGYHDSALLMPPMPRAVLIRFLQFRDAGCAGLRMLGEPIATPWSTTTQKDLLTSEDST